jgi:hypothetical protein
MVGVSVKVGVFVKTTVMVPEAVEVAEPVETVVTVPETVKVGVLVELDPLGDAGFDLVPQAKGNINRVPMVRTKIRLNNEKDKRIQRSP